MKRRQEGIKIISLNIGAVGGVDVSTTGTGTGQAHIGSADDVKATLDLIK